MKQNRCEPIRIMDIVLFCIFLDTCMSNDAWLPVITNIMLEETCGLDLNTLIDLEFHISYFYRWITSTYLEFLMLGIKVFQNLTELIIRQLQNEIPNAEVEAWVQLYSLLRNKYSLFHIGIRLFCCLRLIPKLLNLFKFRITLLFYI